MATPSPIEGTRARAGGGEDANDASSPAVPVCLAHCAGEGDVPRVLGEVLEKADLARTLLGRSGFHGARVLVKPNLLRSLPLACTSPAVVAALCAWLLDNGAGVTVSDSPGFGTAASVARDTGTERALAPLGIRVDPMGPGVPTTLATGRVVRISSTALECDCLLSVPRVKAHSQMRLTVSCKNLYGCVPGLAKAVLHTREGTDPARFADMQAALLSALPPVGAVVDGVVAMERTGPAHGDPYPLGLLGASPSPVAMDEAVCAVLGRDPADMPLQAAFIRAGHPHTAAAGARVVYPLDCPGDWSVSDFRLPEHLLHTSFRPLRLLRSCLTRLWKERFS